MLDCEGQRRRECVCTHVCIRACMCVCMRKNLRIKMGTETSRGKFPFGWLTVDNSFLEEEMGGQGAKHKRK